jgi:hypothetical protein
LVHTITKIQKGQTVWEREIKEDEDKGANSKGEGQPIEAQILILIFNPFASLKEKTQKDELSIANLKLAKDGDEKINEMKREEEDNPCTCKKWR